MAIAALEQLREDWEPLSEWIVNDVNLEDQKEGLPIIGRIEGDFFFPDGVSRNKRFYGRSVFEGVLGDPSFKKRLAERLIYGSIGHVDGEVTEQDLLEGRVSHIVTDLYIDERGVGRGKADILDTPAGRLLKTYLKAGSKLRVSSRAMGAYRGMDEKGNKVVDPRQYVFETFDFVIKAGFDAALPSLKESLEQAEKRLNMEDNMNESFRTLNEKYEVVFNENNALKMKQFEKEQSEKALKERLEMYETLLKSSNLTVAQLQHVLESVSQKVLLTLANSSRQLDERAIKLLNEHDNIAQILADYKEYVALGTPEEIQESVNRSKQVVDSYTALGAVSEVKEKISGLQKLVEEYQALGTPEEIATAASASVELINQYKEMGSPEELSSVMKDVKESLEKYTEIGSVQEITETLKQAKSVIQSYKKFGKPEEVGKALVRLGKLEQRVNESKTATSVEKLSQQYGAPRETVQKLLERHGVSEVEAILKGLELQPALPGARNVNEGLNKTQVAGEVLKDSVATRFFKSTSAAGAALA